MILVPTQSVGTRRIEFSSSANSQGNSCDLSFALHHHLSRRWLRIRRGCSFHGLAFNVDMDLEPYHRINPCGYKGLEVTQVLDLGGPSRLADVEDVLVQEFCKQFGFHAEDAEEEIRL